MIESKKKSSLVFAPLSLPLSLSLSTFYSVYTTLVWMMEGAWCACGGCMEFMFFSCCSSQPAAVLLLCPACLPA
jgi:hypothetical protein